MSDMYDENEIRNNILAEIHNRLAEISAYLKVGITLLAKLSPDEVTIIQETEPSIDHSSTHYHVLTGEGRVGCDTKHGLYIDGVFTGGSSPLGEMERTAPINEETCCFIENESQKKQEDK